MPLPPGTRLGVFEIEARLGRGGMGEVYRAYDTQLGRSVAIKVLPPELARRSTRRERFEREARILASLNHPNIATLYGFHSADVELPAAPDAQEESLLFLAMELVEGESLKARLERRVLSVAEAVAVFRQVSEGLEAAHERGIVHRDLKPANLMTSTDGRVKILDFGIAKSAGLAPDPGMGGPDTAAGVLIGTSGYMSPEQIRGKPVDKRSDIWSFGCVLFESVAGVSPFPGETPADRTAAMLTGAPALERLPAETPPALLQLVRRCLVSPPMQRLRDIGEARVQLEALERQRRVAETVVTGWSESAVEWRAEAGASIPGRPSWKLSEELGAGSFGTVWLARHHKTGAARVFKLCFDAEKVSDLRREVALLRMLRESLGARSDIAQPIDWQLDSRPAFLELEYSEGGDLRRYLEERERAGGVPLERRIEIVAQTAVALAAAHSVGVLHKDLKPGNILVSDDPETGQPQARLSDFGIGYLLDRELLSRFDITLAGMTQTLLAQDDHRRGTPLYMAPEVLGGHPPSMQTDIYSLGVVLYQAVVGDFRRALASGWERDVPDEILCSDIAACVDGKPERRLVSAAELAVRLRNLEGRRRERAAETTRLERERTERLDAQRQAQRVERRRRQLLGAGILGSVLLILALGVAVRERAAAGRERDLREHLRERLYVSDMNLAALAYNEGSWARAVSLLEKHRPQPGERDLRQWEWYHWWHATHLEEASRREGGGPFSAPLFSQRDSRIATVDFYGRLRLYDPELAPLGEVQTRAVPGGGMAVSPEGERIAVLAVDGGVEIWDANVVASGGAPVTGPTQLTASALTPGVRGVLAFSADGELLVGGDRRGRLAVWRSSPWEVVRRIETPAPVAGLVIDAEGRLIVATSRRVAPEAARETVLCLYDLPDLRLLQTVAADLHLAANVVLATSADLRTIASAGLAGVGIWSFGLDQRLSLATDEPVSSLALSPDAGRLAAGLATRASVEVWDLTPEPLSWGELRGHEQAVAGVSFGATSAALVSTGQDQRIKLWDLEEARRFDRVGPAHLWGDLAYSDDGRFLSFSGGSWPSALSAERWDVEQRRRLETLDAARGFVHYAVSQHGGTIAAMTPDGELRIGDLGTGAWRPVLRLGEEERSTVGPLGVSADGAWIAWDLARKTPDARVVLVDVRSGVRTALPEVPVEGLPPGGGEGFPRRDAPSVSQQGGLLVEHGWNRSTVWNLTVDPPVPLYVSLGFGQETCASFSADGTRLAICSQDNSIRVLDAGTGELLNRLEGHAGFVTSAAFSRDGGTLASAGSDGTIRLWDVDSGELRTTLGSFDPPPWRVALSPRGDSLATIHGDRSGGPGAMGELRVWRGSKPGLPGSAGSLSDLSTGPSQGSVSGP